MLRKLVIASATMAAAAGLGLASPAQAQELVDVTCTGPTFGAKTNSVEVGDILGAVTATGGTLNNVIHDQSSVEFAYTCGDGGVSNVGNTDVLIVRRAPQPQPPVVDPYRNHRRPPKHAAKRWEHGAPPWAHERHGR
jgi:hypothetical protein